MIIDQIKFFARNGNNVVRYSGEIQRELSRESELDLLREELKVVASEKTGIPLSDVNIDFSYRLKK